MLTAFDVGFGLLLLISAILATARGLTREVLSLVTWLGSAALAAYMYFKHPEIARAYIKDPLVADIATVAVTFIVALVILHLITMRIADFVVDSRIGALDRTLGFIFGILRGVVIAVVVVIFGLWLYSDPTKLPDWASESKSLPLLRNLGDELIAALPPNLEEQVNNLLKRGANGAPAETGGDETGDNTDASPNDTTPGPEAAPAAPDAVPATPGPAQPAAPAPAAPANSGA
ncbi:MAG TPA: CvpA family protein [Devosia sp.]|nr:CvpA family protein [Devosia sp.]